MSMYLRRLTIRLMIPIVWRLSKQRAPRTLQRFSSTEADSAWQFLNALDAADDLELRTELFHNALEEVHHASEFERMAVSCSNELLQKATPERLPLYDPSKPFSYFLAYVYVGESDVYDQFGAYSAAVRQALTGQRQKRNFFDDAKEDEDGHLKLAHEALLKEYPSKRQAEREILKIRWKRGYEAWLRFSKNIGEVSSAVVLSLLYFVMGPMFVFSCRKRLDEGAHGEATLEPNATQRVEVSEPKLLNVEPRH